MTSLVLYRDSHNVVEVQDLTDQLTDAVVTDATVTVTVTDTVGVEVVGDTWPKDMPHVAAGTYRAVLDYDLELELGIQYVAEFIAIDTSTNQKVWRCKVTVKDDC